MTDNERQVLADKLDEVARTMGTITILMGELAALLQDLRMRTLPDA